MDRSFKIIDCTLRDGGYYNNWDFSRELVTAYLAAMSAANIEYVEIGFRSFAHHGFRGAYAYSTDRFLRTLLIPENISLGVMVNASELIDHIDGPEAAVTRLFSPEADSPVTMVRIAGHAAEINSVLTACQWLKRNGYKVGLNLMQIADRTQTELEMLGKLASSIELDVLYFADSLGSLQPNQTAEIIQKIRSHWHGDIGIHTHDNMGYAMANSLAAVAQGVTWIDCTVTGMGRGPGNAQTELIVLERGDILDKTINPVPLLSLVENHFKPMKARYGWGKNPYYYLAGKYGIHPTYVQQMLSDVRYGETEILSAIAQLKNGQAKSFSTEVLETSLNTLQGQSSGAWTPSTQIGGREVLIVGSGESISDHKVEIEQLIAARNLYVIALNSQAALSPHLIDIHVACHPFRLHTECKRYRDLLPPLAVPRAHLDPCVLEALKGKELLDFGLTTRAPSFEFSPTSMCSPFALAAAYAIGIATSGEANRILLAGFDGYSIDDPRFNEMNIMLQAYQTTQGALPLLAITPSRYSVPSSSVYAL